MEVDNNLTAERSLEIIRESIERSQRTINKNSALPLIWWGAFYRIPVEESWWASVEYALGCIMVDRICRQLDD